MDDLPPNLRRLDDALADLYGDADPMLLSQLDGFVAGVLVCPDLILQGEWLPYICGGEEEPVFGDIGVAQKVLGMVMEHHNAVSADLYRGHGRNAPVFDIDTRDDEILGTVDRGLQASDGTKAEGLARHCGGGRRPGGSLDRGDNSYWLREP